MTVSLFFCVHLLFSYPLVIVVTNTILESFIFYRMKHSTLRTWLKNLSRTLVLTAGVVVATTFYYSLPHLISLVGVVFGSFVVIITPSLVHYNLCAESAISKAFDLFIFIYAVCMITILGSLVIYDWVTNP